MLMRVLGHFVRTEQQIRNVKRAAEMLSVFRKRILRRIPGIRTQLAGPEYDELIEEDKEFVDQAFDEYVDL